MANLSVPSPGTWILDIFGKHIFRHVFEPDDDATLRQTWDYLAAPPSHPGTEYLVRDPLT